MTSCASELPPRVMQTVAKVVLVAAILVSGAGCRSSPGTSASITTFAQVVDGGFVVDGKPFVFVGTNLDQLAMPQAFGGVVSDMQDGGTIRFPQIDEALGNLAADGFTVIRIWGFLCQGGLYAEEPSYLKQDLSLNEQGLSQLDYTIASAGRHGLRVILPLVNFDPNFCGMGWWVEQTLAMNASVSQQELSWSCVDPTDPTAASEQILQWSPAACQTISNANAADGGTLGSQVTREYFMFDPSVKAQFKTYVQQMLTRVNPYTGREYRQEPAIFALELANEPHTTDFYECLRAGVGATTDMDCQKQQANLAQYGSGKVAHEWLAEMSAFVRSFDSEHLISSGEEGYRSTPPAGQGCSEWNDWMTNGWKGDNWVGNAAIPDLSFTTVHVFPDNWDVSPSELDLLNQCFIADRAAVAAMNHKPIVLEETGFYENSNPGTSAPYADRAYYLSKLFGYANQAGYQGTMVWQANPRTKSGQLALAPDGYSFPMTELTWEGVVYTPEGEAMKQQIDCAALMAHGKSPSACVPLCPAGTTVDSQGLGVDPQGKPCALPSHRVPQ